MSKMVTFSLLACLWTLVLLLTNNVEASARTPQVALALLIGNNQGGPKVTSLRFAESDAQKMRTLLLETAGFSRDNIWLLLGQSSSQLRRAMRSIQERIRSIRQSKQAPQSILLWLYYSGHAQRGRLLLGKSSLTFQELHRFLRKTKADIRLAIIDACESGSLTKSKGLKHRKQSFPLPKLHVSPTIVGEVLITATGSNESAHEDPRLRGGVFTHYLVSGLRGAADHNRDGSVTLSEIYHYAYMRSLERTILSVHGPQRAHFRKKLSGYGKLILSTLSRPQAWLLLKRDVQGALFVWDRRRKILHAEINKSKGRASTIALAPGHYLLQWRQHKSVYSTQIQLRKGQRLPLRMKGRYIAYWRKGITRGRRSQSVGRWVSFDGQHSGISLIAQYRMGGYNALGSNTILHGPGLSLHLPLAPLHLDSLSLQLRILYQFSATSTPKNFAYDLHHIHIDVGLDWSFLQKGPFDLGLGARLRVTPTFQNIHARSDPNDKSRAAETILSSSYGAGLSLLFRWELGKRWFLHTDIDAGPRLFDLAGQWSFGWTLSASLGFGARL